MREVRYLAYAWWKVIRRGLRRWQRGHHQQGAALVELAIALSLLLLLMMGVAEFSAAYKDVMVLNHATREGVRCAAVGATASEIDTRVKNFTSSLDTSRVATAVTYSNDDGATFSGTPGIVDGRNDVPTGSLIRVSSQYPHRLFTGLVLPGRSEVTLRCVMVMQRQ